MKAVRYALSSSKKIKKSIKYFLTKRVFDHFNSDQGSAVYISKNKVYKFAWGERASQLKDNSIDFQKMTEQGVIWNPYALHYEEPIKSINKIEGLYMGRAKRLQKRATQDQVDQLIKTLINQDYSKFSTKSFIDTLDKANVDILCDSLSKKEFSKLRRILKSVEIPVTTAHGDLLDQNIMFDDNLGLKIIDWEYFRSNGSFITDILRLYSRRNEKKSTSADNYHHKQFDPSSLIKHENVKALSEKFDISFKQLSIMAAVTNTTLPVINSSRPRVKSFIYYLNKFIAT